VAYRLQHGSIIWANISDPQGRNAKDRPAVVVMPSKDIEASETVIVVVATTVFEEPLTAMQVKLPWHKDRHPKTGLYAPCIALCNWIAEIPKSSILDIGGQVPGKTLHEILDRLIAQDDEK
jgi:mRNA-degrading endonuclease toxin of MazEF toxin-antitoxin module